MEEKHFYKQKNDVKVMDKTITFVNRLQDQMFRMFVYKQVLLELIHLSN